MAYPSVCKCAALIFFCVLITVREAGGAYVPGRCVCPETQRGVRGQLKDLTVLPKSPNCDKITVIVTLTNEVQVCLTPNAPMGKQLIHCWNRAQKLKRDTKPCLRRRRRSGQKNQRRSRVQRRKASSQNT